MDGLFMKYFVLKPSGNDVYAMASRAAINTYAAYIQAENPEFSDQLREWSAREIPSAVPNPSSSMPPDEIDAGTCQVMGGKCECTSRCKQLD